MLTRGNRAVRHSVPRLVPLLLSLVLVGCVTTPADWLFACTGEEEFLGQARGALQLVADRLRAQPGTARFEPVAYAGVNPFGINTFLEQEVEPWKRERSVEMIAEVGFRWMLQQFPWEDIEIHGRGDFEDRRHEPYRSAWDKYDHIVDLAEQYGLEIIARLGNPPAWSRADGDARGTLAPPDDLEDFGNYVYAVVSRYRGRIRFYQVWNEPNIYPEWGEQAVDPEGYTQLLCTAYRRAREADPDVVIISGALAQTKELSGRDLSDLIFLQRMYDAGAADCFDILAVNNYMIWSGPTDHRLRPLNVNFSRPVYLRDVMVANGDSHTPIWIGEMNSNAVPDDPTIARWGDYGQVTLEQQARYAPLAYERIQREWPWVGVVSFWFFRRPSDAERDQAWYYFRMAEPDFTTLPVYDAMREYIDHLVPALYPGAHQEDHWALDYTGSWETVDDERAVLGAYRRAAEPDSTIAFYFEGGGLTLSPGPGAGVIAVQVDGGETRTLVLDGRPVRLFSALTSGRHHVQMTVVEGQVGVDSLAVHDPSRRPWLLLGLLVALALGALGLCRWRGRRAGGAGSGLPTSP